VSLVSKYVEDGTVTKDVDALDLLEWATMDLTEEDDFLDTLGPLRVRAVKASPKDMHAASKSLESCLIHWDLNSAQQIAAVLDRSFPHERHFMFWNIAITHLLSVSLPFCVRVLPH
jgi:N-terminal acetyltransferase B complex non-catalytic subunit